MPPDHLELEVTAEGGLNGLQPSAVRLPLVEARALVLFVLRP